MADPVNHDELMRFIDGELSPDERSRVAALISGSSELQREVAVFQAMKGGFLDLSFVEPGASTSVWSTIQRRITRPVGWILLVVGILVWIGYGAFVYAQSPALLLTKLATGAMAIGILLLLAEVIWERYREQASDPYRDVYR